MSSPSFDDLRALELVARLGTVTRAAAALRETKGSISRRLARLEAQLGVPLLRRGPSRVEPTAEGARFVEHAVEALRLLDRATQELRAEDDVPSGTLRVTAPADLAAGWLAPALARFVIAHPGVRVELLLSERLVSLDDERIDFAIRGSLRPLEGSTLVARRLARVDLMLVASPAYLARRRAPRAPQDLAEHSLLVAPYGGGDRGLSLRPKAGGRAVHVALPSAVLANDYRLVRELALADAGIGVLPRLHVDNDLAAGALVDALPRHAPADAGTLYLVHRREAAISRAARAFRAAMLAQTGPR